MPPPSPFEHDQTLMFRPPAGWTRPPPVAEPVHLLLLLVENSSPKPIPLRSLPVRIRRTEPADLVLGGRTVSRRHGRPALHLEQIVLSDLRSTSGTCVDKKRVGSAIPLHDGATIAFGGHRLRYHRRGLDESTDADAMDRDLEEASRYVAATLPPPIEAGPVRVDWFYQSSTRLAGDAFSCQMPDQRHFAVFLIDVAGHGTGAALHAVSVANVLRQGQLPAADRRDPAAVLRSLTRMFPMEQYNGHFYTIRDGRYDTGAGSLRQ